MSNTQINILKLTRGKFVKIVVTMLCACMLVTGFGNEISTYAASVKVGKPTLISEYKYDSTKTHPSNKQTSTLIVNWKKASNAKKYEVYLRGGKGKYKNWTKYKTVTGTSCTVTGLARQKSYKFKVRAVNGSTKGSFSKPQMLKTAKMDYNQAGWEAMARIVYHEVGQMAGSSWDKPIVYVSDCVVNRYVAAKYTNNSTWKAEYRRFNSVQDIIYRSGGFMSDAGLARDGATYNRVTKRVKDAVYGAVYGKTTLNNIKNDDNIYFWCNRSYKQSSSKIAYSFKIPWGYFNVWRSYWG